MKKVLYLLRSVPGAGKSTLAEALTEIIGTDKSYPVCCADDYHMVDGQYKFDFANLGKAHEASQTNCELAMLAEMPRIAVANTNTSEKEIKPYYDLAEKHGYMVFSLVVENRHGGVNTHGVPEEALDRMEAKIKDSLKLR